MTPLVSVLMPIFNCSDTLPLALSSLCAQTYGNWECLVVDDGSSDRPEAVVQALRDPRIRYHPLQHNYGRGYARQRALEMASGRYVAFLDGDDWIFPSKLAEQVELFRAEPTLAVVSSGMAIANRQGQLVGVRSGSSGKPQYRRYRRVGMPSFSFPASMLPSGLAKQTGFDPSFPTAEDTDFLLRAALGKRYAVISRPLYVYREQGSMPLGKVSPALTYCRRMFWKHFRQSPARTVLEVSKARGKQILYHGAAMLGLWDAVIARRSRRPNQAEREQYRQAWETVSAMANQHLMAVGAL